jgi:adenylate cyclase
VENLGQNPHLLLHTVKGPKCLPLVGRNYWTIGRSQDSDLVIPDQCISRNHAILQCTETGEFYLIDLGSRNGTFVNGRRVSIPVTLRNQDKVTFGKTELDFYCPVNPLTDAQTSSSGDSEEISGTLTSVLHQRRLMSVLVVDMRNFTLLARQLEEDMLSTLIGNWFRQAGNIIRNSGSWVDKYIGDAIMAIWFHGQEEVTAKDLIEIFQAIRELNKMTQRLSRQYPLPFPLQIGAGVNTGYAMVGNTGSGDHPDYTAIGDTVNAAFRLESSTKEIGLDIAIGKTTYYYLSSWATLPELFHKSSVKLKGYDELTLTYGISFEDLDIFLDVNKV